MIHEMKLDPVPYTATKSGQKKIEVRLCDEKRENLRSGDDILFVNNETKETLRAQVKAVRKYSSIEDLARNEKFAMTGGIYRDLNDWIQSIYGYYSHENQAKFGLLAIEVELT